MQGARDAGLPRYLRCRNAGDAGEVGEDAEDVGGDAGDCQGRFARDLQCFLKAGQRGTRSLLQGQGCRGCFGVQMLGLACVQVMQGMLEKGRSLGCNKTNQRYTLRVGLPSLFELEDTQRSWILQGGVGVCCFWLMCLVFSRCLSFLLLF